MPINMKKKIINMKNTLKIISLFNLIKIEIKNNIFVWNTYFLFSFKKLILLAWQRLTLP